MTDATMIERIAAEIWGKIRSPRDAWWPDLNGHIREIVESDARNALEAVRAAGLVVIDPEGPIDSHGFCAADDQLKIEHNGIRYSVGGVHEAIREYHRAVRDKKAC